MIGPTELLIVMVFVGVLCAIFSLLFQGGGGSGYRGRYTGSRSGHPSGHTSDAGGTAVGCEDTTHPGHVHSHGVQDAAHSHSTVPDSAVTFDVGYGAGGDGGFSGGFDSGGGGCDSGGGSSGGGGGD